MAEITMYSTTVCPYCSRAEMLLKQRGVKFAFFHKVAELVPNADGSEIEHLQQDDKCLPVDQSFSHPLSQVLSFLEEERCEYTHSQHGNGVNFIQRKTVFASLHHPELLTMAATAPSFAAKESSLSTSSS